jgi:hypothetical protein
MRTVGPCGPGQSPRTGLLALTFGTLLSSQGADAHRVEPLGRSRGNSQTLPGRGAMVKPPRLQASPTACSTTAAGCEVFPEDAQGPAAGIGVRCSLLGDTNDPTRGFGASKIRRCVAECGGFGRGDRRRFARLGVALRTGRGMGGHRTSNERLLDDSYVIVAHGWAPPAGRVDRGHRRCDRFAPDLSGQDCHSPGSPDHWSSPIHRVPQHTLGGRGVPPRAPEESAGGCARRPFRA